MVGIASRMPVRLQKNATSPLESGELLSSIPANVPAAAAPDAPIAAPIATAITNTDVTTEAPAPELLCPPLERIMRY